MHEQRRNFGERREEFLQEKAYETVSWDFKKLTFYEQQHKVKKWEKKLSKTFLIRFL